jgi:hypothetical protein
MSAASDGSAEEEFLLGILKDDNTNPPAPCGMLIHTKLPYDASHILLRFFFLFAGNSLAPQTFVAFESGWQLVRRLTCVDLRWTWSHAEVRGFVEKLSYASVSTRLSNM